MVALFRCTGPPEASPAAGGRARRRASRNDHLLPVGDEGGEVDQREVGLRRRAAGTRDRVGDALPAREAVQPRQLHGADDVHDDRRRGSRADLLRAERDARIGRRRRRACAEQEPSRHHQDDEQHARRGERVRSRDRELRHVAKRGDRTVTRV